MRALLFILPVLLAALPVCAQEDNVVKPLAVEYIARDAQTGAPVSQVTWELRNRAQWEEFKAALRETTPLPAGTPSPIDQNPAEMIVLSDRESNGLSGVDIYLTPAGITRTRVKLKSNYFNDDNRLFEFLDEQRRNQKALETSSSIRLNAPGVVVQYFIYNALPNPRWQVTKPGDMALYASFAERLKPLGSGTIQSIENDDFEKQVSRFESDGAYMMYLNYPQSKYTAVAVNRAGQVRLSTVTTDSISYPDANSAYFNFFKNQALQRIQQRDAMRTRAP